MPVVPHDLLAQTNRYPCEFSVGVILLSETLPRPGVLKYAQRMSISAPPSLERLNF